MNYNEYLNVKSNEIFWLIQALKEQIQLEEKVCSPIYRYIGIVFSNEFMNYEMSIKNVKKILQTILNKYDFLLKKKAMKKNKYIIFNHAIYF